MEVKEMEVGLMYQAVKNSQVDLISGFSTDGRIAAFDLVNIEDDKNYFPPYHAAPLIRMETLERYPELEEVFAQLKEKISDEQMTKMNYLVDQEKRNIKEVARQFLEDMNFKTDRDRQGDIDIVIGSKNFTESFIMAEMFRILIENYTELTCEVKLGFGGTKLLFDAMNNGDVDIYPEYSGTGLLVILKPDNEGQVDILYQKDVVFDYVQKEFQKRYQMKWMSPLGFNNTFSIVMRKDHAEKLGIKKVSDLANF